MNTNINQYLSAVAAYRPAARHCHRDRHGQRPHRWHRPDCWSAAPAVPAACLPRWTYYCLKRTPASRRKRVSDYRPHTNSSGSSSSLGASQCRCGAAQHASRIVRQFVGGLRVACARVVCWQTLKTICRVCAPRFGVCVFVQRLECCKRNEWRNYCRVKLMGERTKRNTRAHTHTHHTIIISSCGFFCQ